MLEELEKDNGDDYMAESIAEAEKEVASKQSNSIDIQTQIKKLEDESEVKEDKNYKVDKDAKKKINKMTDDITDMALQS